MTAIVVSIGDELVLGQTVDTNSAWLSRRLAEIGVDVIEHATVADDQLGIERALRDVAARCDVALVSGGLGPTADDLTRQALASLMQVPLELNEAWFGEMHAFFARLGRTMVESNRIQAMIPRGAEMIWNTCGTAAGMAVRIGRCRMFVMPGVPKEMKAMFESRVRGELGDAAGGSVILSRTLHTFGLGESNVGERLGDLMDRRRNPSVGTTVSAGVVSIRINARYAGIDEARRQIEATDELCRQRLGALVYGIDEQTLPQVVLGLLKERSAAAGRGLTVATAESCTGGLIAKYLTDVPGSSAFFRQGWVVYSNDTKTQLVGVPAAMLREHGAVSEPVVRCMATNAMLMSEADFALAVSGIAGPDGGTADKPVGTVWIALAGDEPAGVTARRFVFVGDREMIRDRAAKMALTMLRYRLLGAEMPF